MASGSRDGKIPDLPRGLIDRRGAPAGKGARLPSLRSPRDLTLGGAAPKKVFIPNIPVRKEKAVKEESSQPSASKPGGGRGKDFTYRGRGRDGGRGRGRGRGEDNFIQLQSVFDQGLSVERTKGWGSRDGGGGGGGGGGRGSGGGGGRPQASKIKQETDEAGDATLKFEQMMRDDFLADGPEEDLDMRPVALPFCPTVKVEAKKEESEEMTFTKVKLESSISEMDVDSTPTGSRFGSMTDEDISAAQLFYRATKSEKEEFIFIQLPTELPGISASSIQEEESGPSKRDVSKAEETKQKPVQCSLRDFAEGYLGKIHVRKSGKTELVLGDIVFDVSMGVPASFLQEVVSIRTEEGDSRMTVLGHVKQKMLISPDFGTLLQARKREGSIF